MKPVILSSNPVSIVLIVIAIVAIVSLIVFLTIKFLSNKRIEKQVSDLSKQYDSLHDLLTDQLEKNLKRVLEISQENTDYEYTYNNICPHPKIFV